MEILKTSLAWLGGRTWVQLVGIGTVAASGYVLWDLYREQLYNLGPYLFLLLCPLMHIFMHRGHGVHGNRHGDKEQS